MHDKESPVSNHPRLTRATTTSASTTADTHFILQSTVPCQPQYCTVNRKLKLGSLNGPHLLQLEPALSRPMFSAEFAVLPSRLSRATCSCRSTWPQTHGARTRRSLPLRLRQSRVGHVTRLFISHPGDRLGRCRGLRLNLSQPASDHHDFALT